MASNPRLIPNKGPRKLINTKKEGRVPSERVNRLRKKKGLWASWLLKTSRILANDAYSDPRHVSTIMPNKIKERQLLT
jgi:hypothetical protein